MYHIGMIKGTAAADVQTLMYIWGWAPTSNSADTKLSKKANKRGLFLNTPPRWWIILNGLAAFPFLPLQECWPGSAALGLGFWWFCFTFIFFSVLQHAEEIK